MSRHRILATACRTSAKAPRIFPTYCSLAIDVSHGRALVDTFGPERKDRKYHRHSNLLMVPSFAGVKRR